MTEKWHTGDRILYHVSTASHFTLWRKAISWPGWFKNSHRQQHLLNSESRALANAVNSGIIAGLAESSHKGITSQGIAGKCCWEKHTVPCFNSLHLGTYIWQDLWSNCPLVALTDLIFWCLLRQVITMESRTEIMNFKNNHNYLLNFLLLFR